MSLPPEIRNQVYELALAEDEVIHIRPCKRGYWALEQCLPAPALVPWREPGLLQSCKTIRSEAFTMYYKLNEFEASLQLSDAQRASDWLRNMVKRCGNEPFKHFTFFITNTVWSDLHSSRRLATFFSEHNLVLTPVPCRPSGDIMSKWSSWRRESFERYRKPEYECVFRMDDPAQTSFRIALEEAADLGRKAREEDWSEDWFEYEFGSWLDDKLSSKEASRARTAVKWRQKQKRERLRQIED